MQMWMLAHIIIEFHSQNVYSNTFMFIVVFRKVNIQLKNILGSSAAKDNINEPLWIIQIVKTYPYPNKKDSKDQELIHSSTTPVPGYHMEK